MMGEWKRNICFILLLVILTSCSLTKTSKKEPAPFDPERAFKEANDLIKEGYYEDARNILEEIRTKDVTGDYAVLARLRIADTYFEDEDYETAITEYEDFLKIYPYHKYAPYAQYRIAMSYFNRIKSVDVSYYFAKKALEEFEKLRTRYPRNPYISIVEGRIRWCKRMLAEYEFYVGKFYFKKGSYSAARNRFEGLLETYPDARIRPDALYYLGLSYKGEGNLDKAREVLQRLIEEFPSINLAVKARDVLASIQEK